MLDKIVDTCIKWIGRIMLVVFGITTMVLVLVTTYGVFMRYIFNNPVPWIEEIQMILVVWMTFFGICITTLEQGNISITLLVDRFPKLLRNIIAVLGWIVITGVLIAVTRLEFIRLNNLFSSPQITATLHIPKYVQYLAVAISYIIVLINHCLIGIRNIRQGLKEEE